MLVFIFERIHFLKKLSAVCFLFFYVTSSQSGEVSNRNLLTFDINKLSIFGDFIYWHASEETSSQWAYDPTPPIIRAPNIYFNWNPGVKGGLNYLFENQLDTKFFWTYFSTNSHANEFAHNGEYIFPQFFNGFTESLAHLTPYNSAEINWRLNMNMLDLEIGHPFKWLNNFTTRPFLGVKGGTINQNIQSIWRFSGIDILGFQISWQSHENVSNNFFGVGPRFGLDNKWNIYKNLSFRGDISGAFLWGHWNFKDLFSGKIKIDDTWTPTDIYNSPTATNNSNSSNYLGSYMMQYFAGLDWTYEDKTSFNIKLGYEVQFWMNQLRIPTLSQETVHGDLTLQGMICGLLIKF